MNKKIPVCSECLKASCWQGIFMCDESTNAGIVYKTKGWLRNLKLEHPSYWKTDQELSDISNQQARNSRLARSLKKQ